MHRIMLMLNLFMIAGLSGQTVELVLPDSAGKTIRVIDAPSFLQNYLGAVAANGQPGSRLIMEQISLSDNPGRLLARYGLSIKSKLPSEVGITGKWAHALPHIDEDLKSRPPAPATIIMAPGRTRLEIRKREYYLTETGTGYGIRYEMEDVSQRSVELLGSWEDDPDGGHLVGNITLDLPNFMGAFRSLYIHGQRLNEATQTISIVYSEPRLPLVPFGGGFSFHQEVRDSLYLKREGDLNLHHSQSQWEMRTGVGISQVWYFGADADSSRLTQTRRLNLELERSTLDDMVNPTKGWKGAMRARIGAVDSDDASDFAMLVRTEVSLAWARSWRRLTFWQEVRAVALTTRGFDAGVAYEYRLGGASSLRGFREEQFTVPSAVLIRNELRLRTGNAGRIYIFTDLAAMATVGERHSAGIGVMLKMNANIIQLEGAWLPDGQIGDAILHIRVINLLN